MMDANPILNYLKTTMQPITQHYTPYLYKYKVIIFFRTKLHCTNVQHNVQRRCASQYSKASLFIDASC